MARLTITRLVREGYLIAIDHKIKEKYYLLLDSEQRYMAYILNPHKTRLKILRINHQRLSKILESKEVEKIKNRLKIKIVIHNQRIRFNITKLPTI